MSTIINTISSELYDKIRGRFTDCTIGNKSAESVIDPVEARIFTFKYTVDGKQKGQVIVNISENPLTLRVYYSRDITQKLDGNHKQVWYNFLKELRVFSKKYNMQFKPQDITRDATHRDLQNLAVNPMALVEGKMYGTKKVSYEDMDNARLLINHREIIDPEQRGARTRKIDSIFVETTDGERLKLPNRLRGARALTRHIAEGGSLFDPIGLHIKTMANECDLLRTFNRQMTNRVFEDSDTQQMVESANEYYKRLNNDLKSLASKRKYSQFKESFNEQTELYDDLDIQDLTEKFTQRVISEKITQALPIVYKAHTMKQKNIYAEEFEKWADSVVEGTSDDQLIDGLVAVLSGGLPVGVDAINARESLDGMLADDELMLILESLAEDDPYADAVPVIMDWLQVNDYSMYVELSRALEANEAQNNEDQPEEFDGDEIEESVGDDYVNRSQKLAIAGARKPNKEPSFKDKLMSIPKGANAWAKGKPDDDKSLGLNEDATELNVGDDVIITGPVEFGGETGIIDSFSENNRFVVVNLYNHGKHSFHASDVSFNDYADSDEEEAEMFDRDPDARKWSHDHDLDEGVSELTNLKKLSGLL